nr:tetratricopeptide repeat protein [uncultured Pseudoxanthomonas sp.]
MKWALVILLLLSFPVRAQEECLEIQETALGAALDDTTAIYNLGVDFYVGACVEKSYRKAAHLWEKAANAGVVPAKNNLGYLLFEGLEVKQDHRRAVLLWTEAARAGHSEAQVHLGSAVFHGDGTEKDPVQGLAWILYAIESAKRRPDDPDGGGGEDIVRMAEAQKAEMLAIAPDVLPAAQAQVHRIVVDER